MKKRHPPRHRDLLNTLPPGLIAEVRADCAAMTTAKTAMMVIRGAIYQLRLDMSFPHSFRSPIDRDIFEYAA